MNKQRKTSHILNVFQYDADGHVVLPASLTLSIAPASNDDSSKVPTTAWVRALASSLGYVTLSTDQTITGLKTIVRSGDVLNFKIGTDTLYGLKVFYSQNELVESGEATWSFASTFNNGSGTGITTTPISFFRGVLVTGQRLLSSSVNANLLDYYANNLSGRYPIFAYNTGVQQFASSIIVGETAGVVNAITGAIADLPSGVVANFKGRVIGSNAVNNNEFITLGQLSANNYATQSYVGTQVANLVDAAPGTLDTLNELAAALGDDPNFATTVSTSIGTKVPQARTITINGTSYDLSADRSWTINSMVYPSAGIALSTGTAWGTSITDNSANWNTAYGWGNHASAGYLTSATAATTYVSLTGSYANPAWITSLGWGKITGTPTTISGYGITNAYTDAQIQNFFNGANAITGYNKSNWDTAYSWGNHASASYALANHTHIISAVAESSVSPTGISIQAGPGSSNTQSWLYPYGTKLSVITGAGRSFEIMTTTYPEGELVLRTLGSGNTWDAWKTVLDSNNYSTYVPTKTGGGASGSWGISVTGSAGSVAWTNVTGRPTSLSSFTNDLGNYGGWITGYTETDTLNSVTGRGNTTSNSVRFGSHADISPTNSAFRFYDGTTFRGGFGTDAWGHSGSDANLVLYVNGDNTLFFSTAGTKRASLSSSAFNSLVALQQSGNQVLHAGNYSSYAFPASGGTLNGYLTVSANWATSPYTSALTIIGTYPSITFRGSNSDWEWLQHVDSVGNFHFYGGAGYTANNWSNKLSIKTSGQLILKNHSTADSGYDNPLWIWATADSDAIVIQNTTSGGTPPKIYFRDTNGIIQTGNSEIRLRTSNSNSYSAYLNGGDWYATGSMRAPIFYDSNDTTYYLDPNSDSYLRSLYLGAHDSGTANFFFGEDSSGWYGMRWYWDSGVNFYWYGRNAGTDTLIMNYTTNDNTYAKWHRHFHMNTYNIDYVGTIYMNGGVYISTNNTRNLRLKGTTSSDMGIVGIGSGDQFAFQLYGDGGGSYGFLSSTWGSWDFRKSNGGALFLNNQSTYYYGSDTTYMYRVYGTADMRSPIYYDLDNTAYYGDFASTSNLNYLVATYIGVGQTVNTSYRIITSGDYYANAGGNYWAEGRFKQYRGSGTWHDVIDSGNIGSQQVNNLSTNYAGGQQLNPQVYFNNGIGLKVAMTATAGYWSDTLWINGYAGGDVLSMCAMHFQRNGTPRLYISTQQSTSSSYGTLYEIYSSYNMDAPNKSGTSYYQTNTWMQFNGFYGLYWPSQYGAHFSPNDLTTYTQFTLRGNKNGYGGINDAYSQVQGIMYDSSGNGGVYRETNSRWYWYYHLGNACMGINTSTTSSSYAAYVSGNIYATGDITAYSDRRKKTDITTIDNALDKVTQLRGVYYTKIDEVEKGRQTGVIAQEINEVLPEVVTYAADVDEYGVKYGNIVGVLIEAIKEQQKHIEDLTNKIDLLTQNK